MHNHPTSFETKLSAAGPGCQGDFETLLYCIIFAEAIMSARDTAELLLLVGRLVQAEGYDGELSPAQWMALRSPAPTRSPGPHRPSRNFKRRPVARHHKPSRHSRQVDTWFDSDPRQMGAALLSA